MTYLWIALGSALGGVGRHWCNGLISERLGGEFPWGTIVVNVVGSFVIGVAASLSGSLDRWWPLGADARAFVMVGLCGGYTTFSAFSLQTLLLLRDGEWARAFGNVLLSVALCLVAVWLGHLVGLGLTQTRTG